MNIKQKIQYLKQLKYHVDLAKTCNKHYSLSDIKTFTETGLFPSTSIFSDAMLANKKVSISGHVKRKSVSKRLKN